MIRRDFGSKTMTSNKKRKLISNEPEDQDSCLIFFVPDRIQKARLTILTKLAKQHNIPVLSTYSNDVTHIISAYDNQDQVIKYFNQAGKTLAEGGHIVNVEWFTESVKCGHAIPVLSKHVLKSSTTLNANSSTGSGSKGSPSKTREIPTFACQRKSPLQYKNRKFVEALLSLADYADMRSDGSQNDYGRSLAFNKAAAVLKYLDFDVTNSNQLKHVKDIGEHSKDVIQDIISNGFSHEVEELCSTWYQIIKMFTGVYGVGPTTAKKWYGMGMRSLADVVINEKISLKDERLVYGIAHYTELNSKVSRSEADKILKFISDELKLIDSNIKAELMGGFKRGKPFGHDCDILISHAHECEEVGILSKLYDVLKGKQMIIQGTKQGNTFNVHLLSDSDPSVSSKDEAIDEFEKFIGMLKFERSYLSIDTSMDLKVERECLGALRSRSNEGKSLSGERQRLLKILEQSVDGSREWVLRRVDLVVTPRSQYPYAVLGWTGNKNFNRSIRLYAKKVKNIKLSSHGMWSFNQQTLIPATSEEEIFRKLELDYIRPEDRNV